ncbi:MAG: FGGY family carbohydrate kinase [Planctomycetia bacterium]|nr:FGGY family carbohydrate kinase [Planctomycetia bacterium]
MSNTSDRYSIGIDIGTSSICGILYDRIENRHLTISKANDANLKTSRAWEKIQDPRRILEIAFSILSDFLRENTNISAIGITGQMHGILYYDAQGQAVSPLYTWQDARGNLIWREDQTYSEFLTKESGSFIPSGYGLTTHFFNLKNGLVPKDAVGFCTIADYVVMKLTGQTKAITDRSNAASLGLFDVENGQFGNSIPDLIGMDPSFLPIISNTGVPAGNLNTDLLKNESELEIPQEIIPVFPAIGDNQAAFLGAIKSCEKNGNVLNLAESVQITIGTGSQMAIWSDHYVSVPDLETRPCPRGGYLLVGAALSGGSSFALLKNFFEKAIALFDPDSDRKEIDFYKIMIDQDWNCRSRNPIQAETFFCGTRKDPRKRGAIKNIALDNFLPEDLIFAFLQGMIDELYGFYQKVPKELRKGRRQIACSGNTLRKNELLRSILEKTFGLPLRLSDCEEEAAFGAADIDTINR